MLCINIPSIWLKPSKENLAIDGKIFCKNKHRYQNGQHLVIKTSISNYHFKIPNSCTMSVFWGDPFGSTTYEKGYLYSRGCTIRFSCTCTACTTNTVAKTINSHISANFPMKHSEWCFCTYFIWWYT